MYLAGVPILLGTALLPGAAAPFLVVPASLWIVDRWFLAAEEEVLERRFRDHDRACGERGRRWL